MSPSVRRLALTAHIASSVGWLGAVACSFALGVVGAVSGDADTARAVFVVLEVVGWTTLVPLCLASLGTGLIQGLATSWGLWRHYWVVIKLVINIVAAVVLLLYMVTLRSLATIARSAPSTDDGVARLQNGSPAVHAGAALVLLVAATALSVFKPHGVTRYGQRRLSDRRRRLPA